jgi:hypothetical protein
VFGCRICPGSRKHKTITVALVVGLLAGMMAMPAAEAKKKKKKKKAPQPVATTLFMDGETQFGEEDQIANGTYLKLNVAEGSGSKSMGIPNYVGGPNPNCAGNSLMPVFLGSVAGQVVGDMKVTFPAIATPGGMVEVRVWPDVGAQACNEAYIEPAGSVQVALPAGSGTVEATIEGLDFEAQALMMIQITPVLAPPASYGRALYGTADSKVEFSCIPAAKATACSS